MNDNMPDQTQQPRVLRLLEEILSLHEASGNCDCETCTQQLDCLAELVTSGHNAKELLPAVQDHLDCCQDCREEFEALLCILRAEQSGSC
ncbi:MAG TPA: hypothetical protein VKQ72_09270 [Aggregatilineales bacterium]|nr:hypothetical protein [Aggregatilineales bacterium]